jgi:hypothetical protein
VTLGRRDIPRSRPGAPVLRYQSPPTDAAAVGTNGERSAEANGRTPSRQSKNQG